MSRFRLTAARHSKRGRSRGCVGTETRYCRGPAGVQRCASPIAAIHGDFQSAAERIKTAQDQVSGTFMPQFLLFGESSLIEAELAKHPAMKAVSRVIHTDVAVGMNDKPSQALRRGRKTSSMWLAIDAVKKGDADVAISAGNSGALMAMGRFCLRMLPGIDRPAMVMGGAMASVLFDLERPTVGLLNIGVEEIKGREEIREAAELLRAMDLPQLEYIGFVEGDGIGKGAADVIVAEGFSGNIALKAAEGTARQINDFLRAALSRTWRSKIGYLFAKNAFKALRDKLDPNKSNGGVFLGLNGIVVKSHGGTDAEGFAYAVDVGYEMVRYDLLTKINQMLNRDGSALPPAPTAPEAVS